MLVSFSLENWMSFRDKATFSMVASRERQHGDRVPKLGKYQTKVLPIAAIYGGNASGKTNFFKALNFAKTLVVYGTRPDGMIPVEPFLLDSEAAVKPIRFEFVLAIANTLYEYSFAVTGKNVVEEKLVQITGNREKSLYHRHGGKITFHDSIAKNKFLDFAFRGTRDNQLFLTNSVSQKVDTFQPVYSWFNDTLELVAPDSRFHRFEKFFDEGHPLYPVLNDTLELLDTGITNLGFEEVSFETLPLSDTHKKQVAEELKEGESFLMIDVLIARKEGKILAKKLVACHSMSDGSRTNFEMQQESDGSKRVIALLPAFLDLTAKGCEKVYVIDEVDRSLHTILSRRLLEAYLDSCSAKSRAQLLLTTHDVILMDQDILRRDEMWVAERDDLGVSSLTSFNEYKDIRYDKDIRKSYMQGRLGGIPRILLNVPLSAPRISIESGLGV